MNTIRSKRFMVALFAAALLACGTMCALLTHDAALSHAPLAVVAEASEQNDVTAAETLLINTWTVEPSLPNFRPQYFYNEIRGEAAAGTVRFSVYKAEGGVVSDAPVNDVLTDFTLTKGEVSETVRSAMKALPVLPAEDSYRLKATAEAEGYEPLTAWVEFRALQPNGWQAGTTPRLFGWVWGDAPGQMTREPKPLAGTVSYTLIGHNVAAGGETFDSMEALNERLAVAPPDPTALGHKDEAKDYKLVLTVPENGNYAEYVHEMSFRVKKKITLDTYYDGAAFRIDSFYYGINPLYGANKVDYLIPEMCSDVTNVIFSAIDKGGNTVLQQEVLMRSTDGSHKTSRSRFIGKFALLDAGTYTVRADIFEGETYGAASSERIVEIKQTPLPDPFGGASVWSVEPYFDMGDGQSGSQAVWQFGKKAGVPKCTPNKCMRHAVDFQTLAVTRNDIDLSGEVVTTYYERILGADGNEVKGKKIAQDIALATTNMPTDVGKYYAEFSIRENNNYYMPAEAVRLISFEITMADDPSFSTSPYAVGWTWGEFDKDVNLFGAVPTRGGAVDFTVKKDGVGVDGLQNFRVDAQNVIIDENGLADKLNKLDSGLYTLEVHVASAGNYTAFTAETTFRIAQAANSWTVSPNIARWAQYYFKAAENTPRAGAKYGDAVIEVRKKDDGALYYKRENGVESIAELENALAGWYTFTVTVQETSNYSGLYYDIEFQVFSESADMPNNYWVVVPTIESWVAGSAPSEPLYQSLRGTVTVSYCTAELQDGKYVAVGTPVSERPEAPGKYFMLARVRHAIYPQDELLKHDVMFEIFERVNKWTVTPSIQSYSLGDGPSVPTAEALYTEDGGIDIRFRSKADDTVTTELPRVAGEYVMIVTATAKYCAPLIAEVPFTVSLSQNSWVSAPTIKDWSEEETASTPFGEATVGSEHIVYTYARADKPNEILTEKPTSEGSYILYATLAMDGYETLTAQWEFTVASAYNRTLLTIDIIMGVVCCLFTGAAIFFAIKRTRQHA